MNKKVIVLTILFLFLVSFSVSAYTWNGYLKSWTRTNLPEGRYGYDREIWRSGYGIYLRYNPEPFKGARKQKTLSFKLDYNAKVDLEILTIEKRNPNIDIQLEYYSSGTWNPIFSKDFTYSSNLKGNTTHISNINTKGYLKSFNLLPKGSYRIKLNVDTRGVASTTQYGGIAVRLGVDKNESSKMINSDQNWYSDKTNLRYYGPQLYKNRRSKYRYGRFYNSSSRSQYWGIRNIPSNLYNNRLNETVSYYNNTSSNMILKSSNYNTYSSYLYYYRYDGDMKSPVAETVVIKIKNGSTNYEIRLKQGHAYLYRNGSRLKTYSNYRNWTKSIEGDIKSESRTRSTRTGDRKLYLYRYNLEKIFNDYPQIMTVKPSQRITVTLPHVFTQYVGREKEEGEKGEYDFAAPPPESSSFYVELTSDPEPTLESDKIRFTEDEYGSYQLAALSEAGNYPLKFYKVWGSGVNITRDGRVIMDLRGNYSIDKHTDDKHHYNRRMRVKVVDSKGNVDYGYVYIYIASAPYPIGNVSYLNYPSIPNKPIDLSYNKPDLNKFNNTLLKPSPLNTYSFINVSSKVEYPGLSPKITPTESKVILYSPSSLSYQDIRNNPDFKNTQNIIDNFEQAKNMWEKVQDYYNNTEKKDIDYQYGKEYLKAKEEYNHVREVLQTRIEDINYNQYLYDRYRCKVNNYNLNIKNQINNYVNYYNNDYLPKINNWISQKSNYFNSLNYIEDLIARRYSINRDRKKDKETEIDDKKRSYGLVSLQKSEINPLPSPGNYRSVIADIKNRFDNSDKLSLGDGFKDILTVDQRNSIDYSANPKETIYNIFKISPQTTGEIEGSNNYQINDENKPLNCSLGYKEYEDLNYDAERDGLNEDVIRWEKDRYNKIY